MVENAGIQRSHCTGVLSFKIISSSSGEMVCDTASDWLRHHKNVFLCSLCTQINKNTYDRLTLTGGCGTRPRSTALTHCSATSVEFVSIITGINGPVSRVDSAVMYTTIVRSVGSRALPDFTTHALNHTHCDNTQKNKPAATTGKQWNLHLVNSLVCV